MKGTPEERCIINVGGHSYIVPMGKGLSAFAALNDAQPVETKYQSGRGSFFVLKARDTYNRVTLEALSQADWAKILMDTEAQEKPDGAA